MLGKYSSPAETTSSLRDVAGHPGAPLIPSVVDTHLRRGDPPSPGDRATPTSMRGRTNVSTTSAAAGSTSVPGS